MYMVPLGNVHVLVYYLDPGVLRKMHVCYKYIYLHVGLTSSLKYDAVIDWGKGTNGKIFG